MKNTNPSLPQEEPAVWAGAGLRSWKPDSQPSARAGRNHSLKVNLKCRQTAVSKPQAIWKCPKLPRAPCPQPEDEHRLCSRDAAVSPAPRGGHVLHSSQGMEETSGDGDRCPEMLDSPSRPGHRQLWGTLQQCTYIEFVAMLACKVPCISLASAAFVHVHLLGNRYLFYLLPSCTDSDLFSIPCWINHSLDFSAGIQVCPFIFHEKKRTLYFLSNALTNRWLWEETNFYLEMGKHILCCFPCLLKEILSLLVKRGRWSSAAFKYMIDFIQVIRLCDFYVWDHLVVPVWNSYQRVKS